MKGIRFLTYPEWDMTENAGRNPIRVGHGAMSEEDEMNKGFAIALILTGCVSATSCLAEEAAYQALFSVRDSSSAQPNALRNEDTTRLILEGRAPGYGSGPIGGNPNGN